MVFEAAGWSGDAGCNSFQVLGTLNADGRVMIEDITWTEMACSPELLTFESACLGEMTNVTHFELDDGILILSDGSPDHQLTYQPAED